VVKFSEVLQSLNVANFSFALNSSNMDVILQPFYGKNDQPSKHIFKWEVINVTKSEMTIQVNFTDPSVISPRIVSRKFEVYLIYRTRKIKFKLYLKKGDCLEVSEGRKYCRTITNSSVSFPDKSSSLVCIVHCDFYID
jgi:hypothetical protein